MLPLNAEIVTSEIRCSATALAQTLPDWLNIGSLDAEEFHAPVSFPPGAPALLEQAAAAHADGLVPATEAQRDATLMMLRSGTVLRNESPEEARATFALLMGGLADVPADILDSACRAHINEPGTRFFPKSPGELLRFAGPMLAKRHVRAWRLKRLAEIAAERKEAERKRAEEEKSWTEEKVAEANADFRTLGLKTRYRYLGEGRCEHYVLQLGEPDPALPPEEAEAA